MADALGINPEAKDRGSSSDAGGVGVVYADELVGWARGNVKFVPVVEKAFNECVFATTSVR